MEPRAESGRIRPGAKNKKGAVCKQGESEASSPTSPPPLLLLLFFLSSPLPPSPRSLSLPARSLLLCRQGGRAGRKRAGGRKGFGVLGVGGGGCLLFCNHPHATHPGEGGGRRRKAVGWGGRGAPAFLPPPSGGCCGASSSSSLLQRRVSQFFKVGQGECSLLPCSPPSPSFSFLSSFLGGVVVVLFFFLLLLLFSC